MTVVGCGASRPRCRRQVANAAVEDGWTWPGVHTWRPPERTVPAPTRTASAVARRRPMRKRSGANPPLTSRPPLWPRVSNAMTPSSVLTKFETIVGLSRRSAVARSALYPVSYTHLRAHETDSYLVCRLL